MTDVSLPRPVRHDHITEQVHRDGAVQVAALSTDLGVSAATIRRDIEVLEQLGVLRRVHGGAVRAGSSPGEEPPRRRQPDRDGTLAALADAAASQIRPGATVSVSGGTAAAHLAAAAVRAGASRIVTCDLGVVRATRDADPTVDVLLAPGVLTRQGTVVGPAAVAAVTSHRCDVALLVASLHDGDVVAKDHWSADVCAALLRSSARAVLLVDEARASGLVTFAVVADFAVVLTDHDGDVVTIQPGHPRNQNRPAPAGRGHRPLREAIGKDGASCPSRRSRP